MSLTLLAMTGGWHKRDGYINKMLEETSELKPINGTMEAHSEWYNKITKEIASHKDRLTEKEQKKYKLDLVLRVAGRVDSLSSICGQCQLFQQEISQLSRDLWETSLMTKDQQKNFPKKINSIVKHLQKEHKLVTKGHYSRMGVGIGFAIGVAIGATIGARVDNTGIGFPIGIAGILVGRYLDNKAKKEGRII